MSSKSPETRCGYVAIIGEPNSGKSTLINALLKQKLSIVTRKPQTTRQRIAGILTDEQNQIVLLDTPGILDPQYLLQQNMLRTVESTVAESDIVVFVVDSRKKTSLHPFVEKNIIAYGESKPFVLALNKTDMLKGNEVSAILKQFEALHLFRKVVGISALKNKNIDALRNAMIEFLPVHPFLFTDDVVSDRQERFFVAELIREVVFERYSEEIPYATAVMIDEFKEREKGKTFIRAAIYVERDSQKGILIGAGGSALKRVGEKARRAIEHFIGHAVFLELQVKVAEKWRGDEQWLKRFGYTPDSTEE